MNSDKQQPCTCQMCVPDIQEMDVQECIPVVDVEVPPIRQDSVPVYVEE